MSTSQANKASYKGWTFPFLTAFPDDPLKVGPFYILDGVKPELPQRSLERFRKTRYLHEQGNGVSVSCPSFLPKELSELMTKDVVFLNPKGFKALKKVMDGLPAPAGTTQIQTVRLNFARLLLMCALTQRHVYLMCRHVP